MASFGTKFIYGVFGAIIGTISAGALFALVYAMFLPIDSEVGLVAGVIAICVIVGGLIAYFTFKITYKFIVPILGAAAGIFSFLMLAKVFMLKGYLNFLMAIVGAIGGWFFGFKFHTFIRAFATSIVGSFMMVRGIGCYLPGYPNETTINVNVIVKDPNANLELIGYLAAFVIIAIAGTIFQLRTQRIDEEDANKDDAFLSQDEGRTCGCF